MNLNLTLLGEMLTFAVFIWFTMRFVWPPLMAALEERREKIAAGLAAADKGHRDLELAQYKINEMMTEAKGRAAQIIEQANQRANHIVEEAKGRARVEGDRLITLAKRDIEQEYHAAREKLLDEVSSLAMLGAKKILNEQVRV